MERHRESDLTGKVVVITGASRGVGKQAALMFAGRGANVVLAARTGRFESARDMTAKRPPGVAAARDATGIEVPTPGRVAGRKRRSETSPHPGGRRPPSNRIQSA